VQLCTVLVSGMTYDMSQLWECSVVYDKFLLVALTYDTNNNSSTNGVVASAMPKLCCLARQPVAPYFAGHLPHATSCSQDNTLRTVLNTYLNPHKAPSHTYIQHCTPGAFIPC
jgi:hypothetical protein